MSKVVLLEEGSKIKVEPFKRFTGGPGSAVGARLPYQSTTQLVENHCTPFFCVNTKITYDTGSPLVPVDQATLNRVEVLRFKVTNYESALKLETKVAALVKDAEHAYQTARAHSDSELRKWAAAAKRSVQLSPGELASVAQHKLNRDTNFFDEAAAREELGRYHRVGNAFYASEIQNNTIALTTAFMYMARLCRKYHFEGGEDSLVSLEVDLVAEVLADAPPDTLVDKIAHFCKAELVHDATRCVQASEMMAAVAAFLERHGEPRVDLTSKRGMTALAALTKTAFDTAFTWLPVRRGARKARPAYEKCTLADPKYKNKYFYCRVALALVALPAAEAVALREAEAEAEAAQAEAAQAEAAFLEEAMHGFELLKDVEQLGEAADALATLAAAAH